MDEWREGVLRNRRSAWQQCGYIDEHKAHGPNGDQHRGNPDDRLVRVAHMAFAGAAHRKVAAEVRALFCAVGRHIIRHTKPAAKDARAHLLHGRMQCCPWSALSLSALGQRSEPLCFAMPVAWPADMLDAKRVLRALALGGESQGKPRRVLTDGTKVKLITSASGSALKNPSRHAFIPSMEAL